MCLKLGEVPRPIQNTQSPPKYLLLWLYQSNPHPPTRVGVSSAIQKPAGVAKRAVKENQAPRRATLARLGRVRA